MKKTVPTAGCRNQVSDDRRGIAAMEAAAVLPMMLILVLGLIEMGTALRAGTIMQSAVREAGRLANMDWSAIVEPGDTPNLKIERDLRNFLLCSGLDVTNLDIDITHAEADADNAVGDPFNIANPDNDLKLLKIEIKIPYADISSFPVRYMSGTDVRASLVLRAGMSSLSS